MDIGRKFFLDLNRSIKADREGAQLELVRYGCALHVIGRMIFCAQFLKRAAIASIIFACIAPGFAIQGDMQEIKTALSEIKTAAGPTAWDRIRVCDIKIDARASSVDQQRIDLVVTLPGRQGERPTPDIALSWLKKVEGWVPNSRWAQTLVDRKSRVGWMAC